MNDHSLIDEKLLTDDAVFNTLMYLDTFGEMVKKNEKDYTVSKMISKIEENMEKAKQRDASTGMSDEDMKAKYAEYDRQLLVVKNAVERNKELGKYVIDNQSKTMTNDEGNPLYEKYGLHACTFQAPNGDVTVVLRGAGAGEWLDNGTALGGMEPYSKQQKQAQEYFDLIVENNGWNETKPNIHVTGHSKGGNKTQFIVMTAEHADLITSGYSIDGQGMSPETLAWMKKELGEKYEERREKLYSISGDNDYVNVLAERVMPKTQVFYYKSELSGEGWHYIDCILKEDGTLTEPAEQGDVSQFVQSMSEQLMSLPPEIRYVATEGMMGYLQMFHGKKTPVNGQEASVAEMLGAIPLILETFPGALIDYIGEEMGLNLEWISNVVTAYCVIYFSKINECFFVAGAVIDVVIYAVEKIIEYGQEAIELTTKIVEFICQALDNLFNWKKNTAYGQQYASANPQIRLDTGKLRDYAKQLELVHNRIKAVDERMDSLYWRAGSLSELKCLISADLRTGYNAKLKHCINYLNEAAEAFDKTEQKLLSNS